MTSGRTETFRTRSIRSLMSAKSAHSRPCACECDIWRVRGAITRTRVRCRTRSGRCAVILVDQPAKHVAAANRHRRRAGPIG